MKKVFAIGFIIGFIFGMSLGLIRPPLPQTRASSVLSEAEIEKIETYTIVYSPLGEPLEKWVSTSIIIRNKRNEPIVLDVIDRTKEINITSLRWSYGSPEAKIENISVNGLFLYYKFIWEDVEVPPNSKVTLGYIAQALRDPPAELNVTYYVNGSKVSPIYERGMYKLNASIGSVIGMRIELYNRMQQVYTPTGFVRPPAIGLVTLLFDTTAFAEPVSDPAPVLTLTTANVLTLAWAATFGLTLDPNAWQAQNLTISGLQLDPYALPSLFGGDTPYVISLNTTIIGNGSWGLIKLPSISVSLAIEMAMLKPILDTAARTTELLGLALEGLASLLSFYSYMFNYSLDSMLQSFASWHSLTTDRELFSDIFDESTNLPNLNKLYRFTNATFSTVFAVLAADIAENGIPSNDTWRHTSYTNYSLGSDNPLFRDVLHWYNVSTRTDTTDENNPYLLVEEKHYFDKYGNDETPDPLSQPPDDPQIYLFLLPNIPVFNSTFSLEIRVWRTLSPTYDVEIYAKINGSINLREMLEAYGYGGEEALSNATLISMALKQFGMPGIYNFSQFIYNLSVYVLNQARALKIMKSLGERKLPLFGYFSIENATTQESITIHHVNITGSSGNWTLNSIEVKASGPYENATLLFSIISLSVDIDYGDVTASVKFENNWTEVPPEYIPYIGIDIDYERDLLILKSSVNVTTTNATNILVDWNCTEMKLIFNTTDSPVLSIVYWDLAPIFDDVDMAGTTSSASLSVKEVAIETAKFEVPPIEVTPPPPEQPILPIVLSVVGAIIAFFTVLYVIRRLRAKELKGLDEAALWLMERKTLWEIDENVKKRLPELNEYSQRVYKEVEKDLMLRKMLGEE